ncbi:MAG: hypothetical protein ACE1ZA_16735, partial [Pseudomonadales bacterium]
TTPTEKNVACVGDDANLTSPDDLRRARAISGLSTQTANRLANGLRAVHQHEDEDSTTNLEVLPVRCARGAGHIACHSRGGMTR